VSTKFCLTIAGAALLLAGCAKKPTRPGPDQTVLGPAGGGANLDTAPKSDSFGSDNPNLAPRDPSFNSLGENRAALQAQTVYFEFDKSDIKASEREKLKVAKEWLDKNPTHKLLLEGHCDWRGTAEYNLSLGDRRSNATKRYLQSIGVGPDRAETLSKGSLEASRNADAAT